MITTTAQTIYSEYLRKYISQAETIHKGRDIRGCTDYMFALHILMRSARWDQKYMRLLWTFRGHMTW